MISSSFAHVNDSFFLSRLMMGFEKLEKFSLIPVCSEKFSISMFSIAFCNNFYLMKNLFFFLSLSSLTARQS